MTHPILIESETQLNRFCAMPALPPLKQSTVIQGKADAHWLLTDDKTGRAVARCSLWWRETPAHQSHRVGLIGHYAAQDAESGRRLLSLACEQLVGQGCTLAIGPMDGNTWQPYRFVTEQGSEPPFFLEPENPLDWPAQFSDSGFTPLANYVSALNADLSIRDPQIVERVAEIAGQGIRIRPLDIDDFEAELERIYQISIESFRQNFLYTPISLADFKTQYQPVRSVLRPELALLAEDKGRPIGFAFLIPDVYQAWRKQTVDTAIFKTLAVHPDYRSSGVGSVLADQAQQTAARLGFRRVIHALMHQTNHSRRISQHTGQLMRRYTLFGRVVG